MVQYHDGSAVESTWTQGSGAQSPWAGMSIGQVLGILDTMVADGASGDAAALAAGVTEAEQVAEMVRAHLEAPGGLVGQGATAGAAAGTSLAGEIKGAAQPVSAVHSGISAASGVLSSAKANDAALRALQNEARRDPDSAAAIRAEVDTIMRGTYTHPMNSAQSGIAMGFSSYGSAAALMGDSTPPPTTLSPSGDGSGASHQGAVYVDAGRAGSAGASSAAAVDGAGPAGGVPVTHGEPSAADQPLSLGDPGESSGGDSTGPGGLDQGSGGGLGGPAAGGGLATTPTGAMPGIGILGGPAGGVGGGSGGSAGSAGSGASSSNPALGKRIPAAIPAMGAGGSPPPMAAPPPSRAGSGPMSPAGARPRSSEDRTTHRAAAYLQVREHGEDIVGELPLVGPPVVGDWAESGTSEPATAGASASGASASGAPTSSTPTPTDRSPDSGR